MNNTKTGITIPLSTFGGLSTELSPTDLPEGGSPDCQDVAFLPGSVQTRPALSRLYNSEPESVPVYHQNTFTSKKGTVFNVKLYASGNIYSENFTNNPGVWTLVGSVAPGSKCKSVEAYGKLWMTFNDGFRGTDLVRKFDGSTFSRVSQGGPGLNASFSEFIGASSTIGNGASTGTDTIVSLVQSDPITSYQLVWVEGDL